MRCIFSCPLDEDFICFTCISLPLHVFSYPDTDIEFSRFQYPNPPSSDQIFSRFIKDEILEFFSFLHLDLSRSHIFIFPIIVGKHWRYPQILIRQTELLLEFTDINSSISRKWNKYTPRCFYARSCEIEMWIAEEGHRLLF